MTAIADKMPKVAKEEGTITPKDLDVARKLIGAIRAITKDPMIYFDKVRKVDIVAALSAVNWYLDQLPKDYGYDCLAAAANMANSAKVKDLGVVAEAVRDGSSKLLKYVDGPLLHDESVYTSSQWRVPIKGKDAAYSAPNLSVINAPSGSMDGDAAPGTRRHGSNWAQETESSSDTGMAPPGGHIPSAQGSSTGVDIDASSVVGRCNSSSSDINNIPDGKVSAHSSNSVTSLAAPTPTGQLAKAGVVGEGGLVDDGMNGSGVTREGGVGDGSAVGRGRGGEATSKASGNSTSVSTTDWRPRVCNQVWRGRQWQCPNRSNGCRFAHPTPCNNGRCRSGPAPGCRAFHPRVSKENLSRRQGNSKGGARKGSDAPKHRGKGPHRPNNSSNNGGNRRSSPSSNGGNGGNRPSGGLHLEERMEIMEKKLQLQEKEKLSYRDVAARGLNATGSSSNTNGNILDGGRPIGGGTSGFGRARPDPAVLSTVVAAVMAVLAGGQHF